MRRQAKLSREDYLVFADDLMGFDLRDVEAGLDRIGMRPRNEGETAFPDVATLQMAVRAARGVRIACEAKERERQHDLIAEQHRKDHPELYCSTADFWKEAMEKIRTRFGKSERKPA